MLETMLDPLHDQLPARLARRLSEPLPGRPAHRRMVSELAYGRHAGPPAWDVRPAAVLVCLYPRDDAWHIPLTLRPAHMIDHAGQVSFPGGMCEPGETVEESALREYEEELGASGNDLVLVGRLTPLYVFASNFLVVPCVAVADRPPELVPNPLEVERVFDLPLEVLLDSQYHGSHLRRRRGFSFATQHICCGDDLIWGATGMMLAETAEVLAQALDAPAAT